MPFGFTFKDYDMKRKMIKIDEKKCTGCGKCIPDCPEGALQLIDGKARLVSDLFCDGLGACIKSCPYGAMSIEEREAQPYDEFKVMDNIVKAGKNTIIAHLKHLKEHGADKYYNQAIEYLKQKNIKIPDHEEKKEVPFTCPGMRHKSLSKNKQQNNKVDRVQKFQSELSNWPIQLKLLNPNAPYLKNADLVIAADCTAFAYPNFHTKFLKDKILIMFCPKLDSDLEIYVQKLTKIFKEQNINSVTVARMEVPCCGGVEMIVKEALNNANKKIVNESYTISIGGELI